MTVQQVKIARHTTGRGARDRLVARVRLDGVEVRDGALGLQARDGAGASICGAIGTLTPKGRTRTRAGGSFAGGTVAVVGTARNGSTTLVLRGRNLDLSAIADPARLGLRVGDALFAGDVLR